MSLMNRKFSLACLGYLAALGAGNLFHGDEQEDGLKIEPQEQKERKVSSTDPQEVTTKRIKDDVTRVNKIRNYNLTSDGLVALARTVYFEGSFDSQVDNNTELIASYGGIAQVILNRYLFDTCSKDSPLKNPNCENNGQYLFGGEKGIEGIVRKEVKGVHKFSCVDDHPHFYTRSSLDDGLNSATYFGRKKKNVQSLNVRRLRFAYNTLVNVLDGSIAENTGGAFYYKNNSATNQVWTGDQAFVDANNSCQDLKYKPDKAAQALIEEGSKKVHCRVETSYELHYTINIGGHAYYKMVPSTTETVFDDKHRHTFVNGKLR